jgi:hypothetical protein
MNHIIERDDVIVLQLLHKRDFAYRRARCAFLGVEMDFFQSNELPGLAVPAFEDL